MLDRIVAATRARLGVADPAPLEATSVSAPPVRDFGAALCAPGLSVIAEIKRRSPSAGPLAPGLDAAGQAETYAAGGAAAISVLTEPEFFDGSLDDLRAVRAAVDLPVLRKDFIVDPYQIWEARLAGADAVLLIVAALSDQELESLLQTAARAGIAALVETHTAAEAERAIAAGASIVGVNNRDLQTFVTDLATAESIAPLLPRDVVRVAESGVSDRGSAARMRAAGYDAVLVGEALVRSDDAAGLISRLRS